MTTCETQTQQLDAIETIQQKQTDSKETNIFLENILKRTAELSK